MLVVFFSVPLKVIAYKMLPAIMKQACLYQEAYVSSLAFLF